MDILDNSLSEVCACGVPSDVDGAVLWCGELDLKKTIYKNFIFDFI